VRKNISIRTMALGYRDFNPHIGEECDKELVHGITSMSFNPHVGEECNGRMISFKFIQLFFQFPPTWGM
jgi:hypothetical protein